ncbi:MAG: hypothetical protein ACRD2Z_15715 [Thermoanaerobaculia bacterium]
MPAAVARSDEMVCRVVDLDPAPRWTFWGTWTENGERLILADVGGGRLLHFARDGSDSGAVAQPGGGALEFEYPGDITRLGDQFLLVDRADRVVRLDDDLVPTRSWRLRELPVLDRMSAGDQAAHVMTISSIVGRGSDEVIGVVNAMDGTAARLGIGRLTLGGRPQIEVMEWLGGTTESLLQHYGVANPAVAVVGDSVYALRFDNEPRIAQIIPVVRELASFPEGFDEMPVLPAVRGSADSVAFFGLLERARTPTGLLGYRDQLFLVTRQPQSTGGTRWMLHQIDPEKDVLVRSIQLPTSSNHIVVVPGSVDWAIVEKGPVVGPGQQAIRRAVMVPAAWIENPDEWVTDLSSRCGRFDS